MSNCIITGTLWVLTKQQPDPSNLLQYTQAQALGCCASAQVSSNIVDAESLLMVCVHLWSRLIK